MVAVGHNSTINMLTTKTQQTCILLKYSQSFFSLSFHSCPPGVVLCAVCISSRTGHMEKKEESSDIVWCGVDY